MKTHNLNAIRERIRQVEIELTRLKMLETLAQMQHADKHQEGGSHA